MISSRWLRWSSRGPVCDHSFLFFFIFSIVILQRNLQFCRSCMCREKKCDSAEIIKHGGTVKLVCRSEGNSNLGCIGIVAKCKMTFLLCECERLQKKKIEQLKEVLKRYDGGWTLIRDSRKAPAPDWGIYNSRMQVSRILVRLKHPRALWPCLLASLRMQYSCREFPRAAPCLGETDAPLEVASQVYLPSFKTHESKLQCFLFIT